MARAETVERVEARAFTVPTERPESDGTLGWEATTIVVFHDHARLEPLLFGGAIEPRGGHLRHPHAPVIALVGDGAHAAPGAHAPPW